MSLSNVSPKKIQEDDLRHTAIQVVEDVPWGTHFCQFYKTAEDLNDVLVPYFEAGLKNNEFCMWVTSPPLNADEARLALEKEIPNLDEYLETGQLEILPYDRWYLDDGHFDKDQVLAGWVKKHDWARENGYDGLRLSGNTFWLERKDWQDFIDYEYAVNNVIGQYHMLAICTYNLGTCSAEDIIDVVSTHQFALIRREGTWKTLKSEKRLEQLESFKEIKGQWHYFMEAAASPIVCLSSDHRITEFNPEAERLYGKKRDEVLGEDYFELFLPPATWQAVDSDMEKVLRGEPTRGFENPVLAAGGERLLQWTIGPLRGSGGQITGVIKMGQDVTERKKIEVSLRRTRDYLEKLIGYANAPIIVWNSEVMITQFNRAFEHLTGYQSSEVVGHELDMLFPETTRQDSLGEIALTSSGEVWESVEIPIRRKDGEVRVALWNSANIYAEDGSLEATIAQGQDITERKSAEIQLRETSDYLEKLLDYANAPIIVWNNDKVITKFNHAFGRLTGYTINEVIGRKLKMLFPESTREESLEKIKQAGAGEYWESVEIPIRRKDGKVRIALWNSANIYTEDESLEATIAQGQDITERKEAEREVTIYASKLEESNKELEAFNYSVSHDLRTPLRAIDGFSRFLQEDFRDRLDEEGCRLLDVISTNTQKMGKLIDDLLSFSRLGRQELKSVEIDMEQLSREVFAELVSSSPEYGIDFEVGSLPPVNGDLDLIRQVLINLIGNAIKFSGLEETAVIKVSGGIEKDRCYYCVTDNGVGFDMKYAGKLFGVFQRLHSDDEFVGTGVGLAIVKRIIQRHDGSVWADGEIGRGATFCFNLPGEGENNE